MARKWTSKEIKILVESNGKALPKIPKRGRDAVRQKALRLGLRPKINRWSKSEIKSLRLGLRVKNRSKNAIRNMTTKLGLRERRKARPKWTAEKEKMLKSLRAKGMSAKEIQEFFPGMSRMAIQKKICHMGLSKKTDNRGLPKKVLILLNDFVKSNHKGHTARQIAEAWNSRNPEYKVNKRRILRSLNNMGIKQKFLMGQAKTDLKKFLLNNWKFNSPEDLAKAWNSKSEYKVSAATVSKILRDMGVKVSGSEVRRINALKMKESLIIKTNKDSVKVLEEKIRLNRVKMMRARIGLGRDIFTGMDLSDGILGEMQKEESVNS